MNMDNNTTWLLIADASKARIFSIHKAKLFIDPNPHNLKLIGEFTHADSRKKASELLSDKNGEFGSGTFEERTTTKVIEAEQFAHELLHHLECARKENTFRDVILVAPPGFMGILLKLMHHEMQKMISQKIEKDYTQQNGKDLMSSLLIHF